MIDHKLIIAADLRVAKRICALLGPPWEPKAHGQPLAGMRISACILLDHRKIVYQHGMEFAERYVSELSTRMSHAGHNQDCLIIL